MEITLLQKIIDEELVKDNKYSNSIDTLVHEYEFSERLKLIELFEKMHQAMCDNRYYLIIEYYDRIKSYGYTKQVIFNILERVFGSS